MDRRSFSKLLVAAISATTLPGSLRAKTLVGEQQKFLAALHEKPWLIGYLGASETELHGRASITSGHVPDQLRGTLLRNGPAMHNIGPDRFLHWFDAPGMVQKFTFADGQVFHHGRMISSSRNKTEIDAGRIKFNAFGTHAHGLSSGGSADGQNPANISLIEHAGEILALWEGGSPHIIDPETLQTKGVKSWSPETTGLPFGAHPRFDQDGSIWNVGYSANPAALILYHISAQGSLLKTHILPQIAAPMIHDFMITQTRILIVASPYLARQSSDRAFVDFFEWQSDGPTRILVIDKDDLTNAHVFEADPFWAFHFGNAYDIGASEIGFDFAHHDDPSFMTQDAFAAMDGSWDGTASAASRYAQGRLNLASGQLSLDFVPELGQVEFIQTDARENLTEHRFALMLAQANAVDTHGFSRLVLIDRLFGQAQHFDVPKTQILEEHLIVPKQGSRDDFWVIGTALDWAASRSNLSVYEGRNLQDGPILTVELDIPLPLGLHGTFLPNSG